MSIYHWKLGDIAMARISKKFFAKIRVIKDEKGLFYDFKVLGITSDLEGNLRITKELCYYTELTRIGQKMWLPYTSLHLAERSRPFYGISKLSPPKPVKLQLTPKKRKLVEDVTLPINVKIPKTRDQDLNTTYDIRHMPSKVGKYENAFKEFLRRGKEMIFDDYYDDILKNFDRNIDTIDYLVNVDASTEDKFEKVLENIVSEHEVENYLRQCWRYNFVRKQTESKSTKNENESSNNQENLPVTVHTTWCIVCGETGDKLRECINCPSSFHLVCRKEWLLTIIHRQTLPNAAAPKQVTLIEKILSGTRTICSIKKNEKKDNTSLCPSCMWGPRIGYGDIVWHKLGNCPWWPAKILAPGSTPSCLISRAHHVTQWPLKYYGTLNHSWGHSSRLSLFLPSHATRNCDEAVKQAALDAADDYIAVYLT